MINRYAKGNRNQNKCRKYFESIGYSVEVTRRDKYRVNQDFFSLWDLICVSSQDILFVQVKTNRKPEREWIDRAKQWECPYYAKKIYVVYKDYQRGDKPAICQTLESDYENLE